MKLFRLIAFLMAARTTLAFSPQTNTACHQNIAHASKQNVPSEKTRVVTNSPTIERLPTSLTMSTMNANDDEREKSWEVNPLYASLWAGFIGFAIVGPGEFNAPGDLELINNFIADPSNPGFSELFQLVFNYLGVMPIIISCLAVPQGSKRGLPATPFLAASFAMGYGAVGPYLTFRAPPKSEFNPSEASWITRNVLDNKIFGGGLVAAVLAVPFVVGLTDALAQDVAGTIQAYMDLFATSKLVSASSMDALILNIVAASLIPQDLKLRGVEESKANVIAASTLFLPFLGAALYCALRPALPSLEDPE